MADDRRGCLASGLGGEKQIMSWSFGDVLTVYAIIGILVFSAGIVPLESAGVVNYYVSGVTGDRVELSDNTTGAAEEMSGSPRESTESVFGGSILAALQFGRDLMRFIGWPVALAIEVGAPIEITLLLSILPFSMLIGFARIVRASI